MPFSQVHIAGPLDAETQVQRCSRCQTVLKDFALRGPDANAFIDLTNGIGGRAYPVGALVERGSGWQAVVLFSQGVTCEQAQSQAQRSQATYQQLGRRAADRQRHR